VTLGAEALGERAAARGAAAFGRRRTSETSFPSVAVSASFKRSGVNSRNGGKPSWTPPSSRRTGARVSDLARSPPPLTFD
jgi:hypothetical protein